MYLDPQDQEKAHKKYLLDFAGKVEMMLASKPSLKSQLKRQCQLCEKKYNDYYRWLETQHEAAKKNPCLLKKNSDKPPKKGYILNNDWWRKPDREDLPDITAWFYPFPTTIKTSRAPNEEEQFMRSCVYLAIIHDNVLRSSQQEPIYFTLKKEDKLASFQQFAAISIWHCLSELNKIYAEQNRERVAKEIQIMLDAALESIKTSGNKIKDNTRPQGNGGEDKPQDIIISRVVIKKYELSKSTLYRAIEDGRLKNYRDKDKPKNSPIEVSRSEVEKHFAKR